MNIVLGVKTHYQLLSSLIKVEDLVCFAKKNNISCIGITDSNLFSFMEFYDLCNKNNIKPIVGIDICMNDNKFVLYAKNFEGYQNLCKIVTEKNIGSICFDFLKNHNKNLICVVDKENFKDMTNIYKDVYICYENEKELKEALVLSDKVLFMNEVLCYNESDYKYLKYLFMVRDNKTINDSINYEIKNKCFNFDSTDFDKKTNEDFINNIDLKLPEFKFNLPKYASDSVSFLRQLCKKGLYKRLNGKVNKQYAERLDYELSIIENTGFVNYFLIVYDIVLYAKKNSVLIGPGRGSAVGSLVSYSLGIIDIDPLKYNLLFERFLNPQRVSMPDIDIDIPDTKREKLVNYIIGKYGNDSVANIITFSTLLPKQVLRDVARVLDLSNKKAEDILNLLKENEALSELKNNYKYKELIRFNKEYISLLDIAEHLEGLKKHISIHAAGIVIDSEMLSNKAPLIKSGNNLLIGYDKKYIEQLGILKIDLLSIRNLSILDEVLNEIKIQKGIDIKLGDIPLDDKKTLELFKAADTIGIFQFESSGIRNLIKKMNVNNFNDLVLILALFRPGPMNMIPVYLNRREGKEKVTYPIKELQQVLNETLGILVYQEQLLEVLNIIGGYSYAEADLVRVAIKSKNLDVLEKQRIVFTKKSLELGFNENDINFVYELIIRFANYGFNKSHSVAYAMLGYQMGYLKANYPEIFMTNLLNKEIGREVKTKEYIDESKVLGLSFSNIDINESMDSYCFKDNTIMLPLTIIKNIGQNAINKIMQEKTIRKFDSFVDFCSRCYCSSVNKKALESLVLVGAFDKFNVNRKTLIENLESIMNYSTLCQELDKEYVMEPEINYCEEYEENYLLECEKKLLGFYFSNHPVTKYRRRDGILTSNINLFFNKHIEILVMIESIKEITTKNNEKMAFLKLSDEFGIIEGIVFPNYYKEIYNNIKKFQIINIYGKVEKRFNNYQLVINKMNFLK